MNSQDLEQYLQKLQGFVFDEGDIITSNVLCKKFNLNAAACQKLLKQFVKDNKEKLGVSYVLAGKLLNGGHCALSHVVASNLKAKKAQYESCNESVYSVQKSKDVDLNAIANVDALLNNLEPIKGSVTCKNAIRRDNIKVTVLPEVKRVGPTDKSKATHLFTNKSTPKAAKDVKKETKSPNKEKTASKEEKTEKSKNNTNKNSIKSMFAGVKPTNEVVPVKEKKPEVMKKEECSDAEMKSDEEVVIEEPTTKKSEIKSKNPGSTSKTDKKMSKRSRKDTSSERPQKRRKRIVENNDSEDDIFEDAEEEDHMESSAIVESDEEEVPVVKKQPLAPINKRRKLVDKTYTDEEGYIVTKKEWVYDSNADDDEEEELENKNQNSQTAKQKEVEKPKEKTVKKSETKAGKKLAKAGSGNQTSIMNFFKKK